jgi:hypothetical protein
MTVAADVSYNGHVLCLVWSDGEITFHRRYEKPSSSNSYYGAGGYEMPNESDDSVSDYIQRVDPDLYDTMQGIYNDAVY